MSVAAPRRNGHYRDRAPAVAAGRQRFTLAMAPATVLEDFPDGGGYPRDFMPLAYTTLGVTDPTKVLHLCSGSVRMGVTVDIRPELRPAIVADVRRLPLPAGSFDWIMADPPYSADWTARLYGLRKSDYPTPMAILREATRVLRPGGRVGILHYLVPQQPPGRRLRFIGVWGMVVAMSTQIRAWTVYEKPNREVLL